MLLVADIGKKKLRKVVRKTHIWKREVRLMKDEIRKKFKAKTLIG